MQKAKFLVVLLFSALSVFSVSCADGDVDPGEGEGEGDVDPGEGEGDVDPGEGEGDVDPGEGEGDVDPGEGEGDVDPGEGEGDAGEGEGEGESITLPFDEIVADAEAGGQVCGSFAIAADAILVVSATNEDCLVETGILGPGDVRVFLYDADGIEIADDDDSNEGTCSLLVSAVTAGDYVVCVQHSGTSPLPPTQLVITEAEPVALGGACDPLVPVCAEGRCLSVANPTDFRCAVETEIESGGACIPDTTAAVCAFPTSCNATTLTCGSSFAAICEATVATAVLGENQFTIPASAVGAPCFENSFGVVRYTPTVSGLLNVVDGPTGSVASAQTCAAELICAFGQESYAITAGVDIFLAVAGNENAVVTYTLSETAALREGDMCTIPGTSNGASQLCDFTQQQYCGGAVGCAAATTLELNTPIPVVGVQGTRIETCYSFSDAGAYTFTTAGACTSGNDTAVRVFTDGSQIARNDDINNTTLCSNVVVTVADGNHLVCTSHFGFDGAVAGVTFTATRQ
jgi:hypothetical protein